MYSEETLPSTRTDNIAPNHNNTRIFEDYEKKSMNLMKIVLLCT